jgi:hypothetical protein
MRGKRSTERQGYQRKISPIEMRMRADMATRGCVFRDDPDTESAIKADTESGMIPDRESGMIPDSFGADRNGCPAGSRNEERCRVATLDS